MNLSTDNLQLASLLLADLQVFQLLALADHLASQVVVGLLVLVVDNGKLRTKRMRHLNETRLVGTPDWTAMKAA